MNVNRLREVEVSQPRQHRLSQYIQAYGNAAPPPPEPPKSPGGRVNKLISYVGSAVSSPFAMRRVFQKRKSLTIFRKVSREEHWFKIILGAINLFWMIVAYGLYCVASKIRTFNADYKMSHYLLVNIEPGPFAHILTGYAAIVLFLALMGLFGCSFELMPFIVPYIASVAILILATAGFGSWIALKRSDVEELLKVGMGFSIRNFRYNFFIAQSIQQFQYFLECCGVYSSEEYKNVLNSSDGYNLPISCCGKQTNVLDSKTYFAECSSTQIVHSQGCLHSPALARYFGYGYTLTVILVILNGVTIFMATKLSLIYWKIKG